MGLFLFIIDFNPIYKVAISQLTRIIEIKVTLPLHSYKEIRKTDEKMVNPIPPKVSDIIPTTNLWVGL
jgi:hypothetical protein